MLLAQDVARKVMFVQKVIVNFANSDSILIKKLLGRTGNRCTLNEIEKIVSLAAEIEIGEKDLEIIANREEHIDQQKYLEKLYNEMNKEYVRLTKKLYQTGKHSAYKYQLEFSHY